MSNYHYHFIIKELENEFKGWFQSIGESTEKYKAFSVPIENKVTKTYEDVNQSVVTISDKMKCIDSGRFIFTIKYCQ